MKWINIGQFENVVTTSYGSFDKALKLGYIIYYDNISELKIISTETMLFVDKILDKGSSYYEVYEGIVLFIFKSEIKILNFNTFVFATIGKTNEENISVINSKYFLGNSSKRNPRMNKNEIVSFYKNQILYKWEDDKDLIFESNNKLFFQTKFKGDLFVLNENTFDLIWKIDIDNGIAGRRYYQELPKEECIFQKYFELNKNNLLKLNLKTGQILWEIDETLNFYNYDAKSKKLFGLGIVAKDYIASSFEIINVETGEREMKKELDLQIPAHLTYYADGFLYFSGYKGDNVTRIFGAVDVITGELAFTQSIEMPNGEKPRGCYDRPVVVDNRLYIRDQLKTLHVYEIMK